MDPAPYRRPYWNTQPEYLFPKYASTVKRAPTQPLVVLPHTLSEVTAPVFGYDEMKPGDSDLTKQHKGEPLGERVVVSGRVVDQHDAPLDPNFTGAGRFLTDKDGNYRFMSIRPGEYPWRNHYNAWRPAHIHFSLFGPAFLTRMVTQMYFPGDPLLAFDPMYNCIANEAARVRLVGIFDWEHTIPEQALGYRFDIVLRGREETPLEKMP